MDYFKIIKNNLLSILFVSFLLLLILNIKSNLIVTRNSINLCLNNIVPSLLPFFIATELLSYTDFVYYFSSKFGWIMKPIFNLPNCSSYALFLSLISGSPIGSKVAMDLYQVNACTKEEAERIITLCSNASPLFIIATVGISFYSNSQIGIILFIIHILSAFIINSIIGLFSKIMNLNYSTKTYCANNSNISVNYLGKILRTCILTSVKNIVLVCGFVVLFSVVISIIHNLKILMPLAYLISKITHIDYNLIESFLTGLIEFTNGLNSIAQISSKNLALKFALSSALLGFGGFSVMFQVLSVIAPSGLSIKKYLIGKILQGILSGIITYIFFTIPLFNLNF